MALIRPSALIGAISGSIDSVTFVYPRGGPIARPRPLKTDPQTELQLNQRACFETTQRAWKQLEDFEQRTWKSAAATKRGINRLGLPRNKTGYNLFMQVNLPRVCRGDSIRTLPGSLQTDTSGPIATAGFISGSAPRVLVARSFTDTSGGENPIFYGAVWTTTVNGNPPLSAYKFIQSFSTTAGFFALDGDAWTAKLPPLESGRGQFWSVAWRQQRAGFLPSPLEFFKAGPT